MHGSTQQVHARSREPHLKLIKELQLPDPQSLLLAQHSMVEVVHVHSNGHLPALAVEVESTNKEW